MHLLHACPRRAVSPSLKIAILREIVITCRSETRGHARGSRRSSSENVNAAAHRVNSVTNFHFVPRLYCDQVMVVVVVVVVVIVVVAA